MNTSERPFRAIWIRLIATVCVATLMALVKVASAKGIALPELLFWRQALTIPVMLAVLSISPDGPLIIDPPNPSFEALTN